MRRGLFFRTLAVLVAVYSGLAHARSLVPGLCATQAALESRCEETKASCCSAPAQASHDKTTDQVSSDLPETPDCAFCHLAKSRVEAIARLTFDPEVDVPVRRAVWTPTVLHEILVAPTHSVRAPPYSNSI